MTNDKNDIFPKPVSEMVFGKKAVFSFIVWCGVGTRCNFASKIMGSR